jgi:hypothetical protein
MWQDSSACQLHYHTLQCPVHYVPLYMIDEDITDLADQVVMCYYYASQSWKAYWQHVHTDNMPVFELISTGVAANVRKAVAKPKKSECLSWLSGCCLHTESVNCNGSAWWGWQ